MARYCEKCGKPIPDTAKVCPNCYDQPAQEDGAALFTRVSDETEVWRTSAPSSSKLRKITKYLASIKKQLIISSATVAVALLAVVITVSSLPSLRIDRALKTNDYSSALSIYTDSTIASSGNNDRVARSLIKSAQNICDALARHEMTYEEASEAFKILQSFGIGTEHLDEKYAKLSLINGSIKSYVNAEYFESDGNFLEAYNCFAAVIEEDAYYDAAQEKMPAMLSNYSQKIVEDAETLVSQENYADAIKTLKQSTATLTTLGIFDQSIDDKMQECVVIFEGHILTQANALAEDGDYTGAAVLVSQFMSSSEFSTEGLQAAVKGYQSLADSSVIAAANENAKEQYFAGDYGAVFALLRQASSELFDPTSINGLFAEYDKRFSDATIANAIETLNLNKSNIPAAKEIIKNASEIRNNDVFDSFMQYLIDSTPVSLVELIPSEKQGSTLRDTSVFIAVDDLTSQTWMWGQNEDYLVYELNGEYDTFQTTFAVRRDDDSSITGRFDVLGDDKLILSSQELKYQSDSVSVSLDITGVDALKIIFYSNYDISSANGGYCHHGLCEPVVFKTLTAFTDFQQTEPVPAESETVTPEND